MSTHLSTQELDGNRIESSHRSGVARAAEVFCKISQNFSPAGVRSPFVARAIPMDTNSGDDWALLRELLRGNGDVDRYISDLSRPDALTTSLNCVEEALFLMVRRVLGPNHSPISWHKI